MAVSKMFNRNRIQPGWANQIVWYGISPISHSIPITMASVHCVHASKWPAVHPHRPPSAHNSIQKEQHYLALNSNWLAPVTDYRLLKDVLFPVNIPIDQFLTCHLYDFSIYPISLITIHRQIYMRRRRYTYHDNAYAIECQLAKSIQSIELSGRQSLLRIDKASAEAYKNWKKKKVDNLSSHTTHLSIRNSLCRNGFLFCSTHYIH